MSLIQRVVNSLGPPLLSGIRFGDWLRLLREEGHSVHPRYYGRATFITLFSLSNTVISKFEALRFGRRIERTMVEAPLFVLGHWRSGTTHLHNLIMVDQRFACPTLFQTLFPHTFLTTERLVPRLVQPLLPGMRPTDNVRFALDVPYEDEFAICILSQMSSYMRMIFPDKEANYDRYVSFREASPAELRRWQEAAWWFLRKLSLRYGRPLALKSPTHTARIALLLQMFPDAKFVHIHRHPFAVFQSTRRIVAESDRRQCLQGRPSLDFDAFIIRQYKHLYDCFFDELGLIPAGHFHQVRYEDLEQDPIGQVESMYRALCLPDFREVEPALRRYVSSLSSYRKNEFAELPAAVRRMLADEWKRSFEEWGYDE